MKSLSYLSSAFRWMPFKWDIRRNDELSGGGDGRVWQAELAPPLWTATVVHSPLLNSVAEQLDARVRALNGAQESFLLSSSLFCAPRADPDGSVVASETVTVSGVGANATTISLAGLPPNYKLTVGDKIQISYTQGGTSRYAFLEASETKTGASGGTLANLAVYPNVPAGVASGDAVTLHRPACKVVIMPGTYKVGDVDGRFTVGGTFKVIQKK